MSRPAAILKGQPGAATEPGLATVAPKPLRRVLAALRMVFGFYFLWAFVDKLFGFGFATPAERAWINGGSPTKGFLSGFEGPFAGLLQRHRRRRLGRRLFMVGLLGIGLALILGIGMRVAAVSAGVLLMSSCGPRVLPAREQPDHRRPRHGRPRDHRGGHARCR